MQNCQNKNGNIIFIFRGKTSILKEDMPFPLLKYLLKKMKLDAQYSGGELKIVANYKKENKQEIKINKYDNFLRNN